MSKTSKLLAALIVIIAVVVSGVFFFQKSLSGNNISPAQNAEIADWQTYTNTKYGFKFMHPSDVGYLSPEGGNFLGFLPDQAAKETNILILGKKQFLENKQSSNSGGDVFSLRISSGFENKDIIMREFTDNKDRFDISDIDINGVKFRMYSLQNEIYNGYNKAYLFDDGTQFIAIRFVDAPLANQILSTFKLTN